MGCVWSGWDFGDVPTWVGAIASIGAAIAAAFAVRIANKAFVNERDRAERAEQRARRAEIKGQLDVAMVAKSAIVLAQIGIATLVEGRAPSASAKLEAEARFRRRITVAWQLIDMIQGRPITDVGLDMTIKRIWSSLDELNQIAIPAGATHSEAKGRAKGIGEEIGDYRVALEGSIAELNADD